LSNSYTNLEIHENWHATNNNIVITVETVFTKYKHQKISTVEPV